MNDYGEIIRLPYNVKDIYEPLKKLLKFEKIRHLSLVSADDENHVLQVIYKAFLRKATIKIKISEIDSVLSELDIYATTNRPIDFNGNRQVVKKLVNIIFKELRNHSKNPSDEISVLIVEKKNHLKSIFNFITVMFLAAIYFFIVFITFDILFSRDRVASNDWVFLVVAIFFGLIYAFIFRIIRWLKRRRYREKRIVKIKRTLFNLMQSKIKSDSALEKEENGVDKPNASALPKQAESKIKQGVNLIQRFKKLNPQVFWAVTLTLGVLLSWGIIKKVTTPNNINGVFIQQLDSYHGSLGGHGPFTFTFKNGTVHGEGTGKGYSENPTYKYKIKGNKIYIIVNGEEVFSDLTIKNKNTLIYGDGVVDEDCSANKNQPAGAPHLECVPNMDGVYKKK